MFANSTPTAEIKVIDFGLSKKFMVGQMDVMKEGVGTLYTMAPQVRRSWCVSYRSLVPSIKAYTIFSRLIQQVLQGVYTSQADMWSLGVVAYMLLSAHRPFYHKKRKVMIDKIMRCDYSCTKEYWKVRGPNVIICHGDSGRFSRYCGMQPISFEAISFVKGLLVLDPEKRMDADKALAHRWLSKEFKKSDRRPDDSIFTAVEESLINFRHSSELKKIALNVRALRLHLAAH